MIADTIQKARELIARAGLPPTPPWFTLAGGRAYNLENPKEVETLKNVCTGP